MPRELGYQGVVLLNYLPMAGRERAQECPIRWNTSVDHANMVAGECRPTIGFGPVTCANVVRMHHGQVFQKML